MDYVTKKFDRDQLNFIPLSFDELIDENNPVRVIEAFIEKLMSCRDELVTDCKMVQKMLCDTTDIEKEMLEIEREIEVTEGLVLKAIEENSRNVIDQSEWVGVYINRHAEATKHLEQLDKKKSEMLTRSKVIGIFIRNIENQQVITEWTKELWADTVETVTVGIDGKFTFKFRNGSEIII